jgi:hypothetical protein
MIQESIATRLSMISLGDKALTKLVSKYDNHTDFKITRSSRGRFSGCAVTGELYHDCDRAPSYTTIDVIMDVLTHAEAVILVALLKAQTEKIRKEHDERLD